MAGPFAIITFRHTGPIKTWSAMRATNVHNARTNPIAHGVEGAPPPRHLMGSNNLERDVRERLRQVGLNPDRLRKNGVIAYEAVLTASPQFFEAGDADSRKQRLDDWAKAQKAWAIKRYSHLRVVSMVLHLDEKTPHIHLVILPLQPKHDMRRRDPRVEWSLVGRSISGPGRFDEVQDDYAQAMAHFGLKRGIRHSGRKHRPVAAYLASLADREEELHRERSALSEVDSSLKSDRDDLKAERHAFELEREAQAAKANQDLLRIQTAEAAVAEEKRVLNLKRQRIERIERNLEAREREVSAESRENANRARLIDDLTTTVTRAHERAASMVDAAAMFERKFRLLPIDEITTSLFGVRILAKDVIRKNDAAVQAAALMAQRGRSGGRY